MPKIQKEQFIKPHTTYSLQELMQAENEIKQCGSENNWFLKKGVIKYSQKKGYEGKVMVKAVTDSFGKVIYCPLTELQEKVRQLRERQNAEGNLNIFDTN